MQDSLNFRPILVVEDDAMQMRQTLRLLKGEGYRTSHASSGIDAVRVLDEEEIGIVLTDRRMPGMDGDALIGHIRLKFPAIPVAIITAYPQGLEALKPDGTLEKPFKARQLISLVQSLLAQRELWP